MARWVVCMSAGLCGLVLLALGARVVIDGRALLAEGIAREQLARDSGRSAEALAAAGAYASAVRCYVPFTSHGRSSLERLGALGDWLAIRGERASARRVWLQGLDAARSLELLYRPYPRQAERLEARLAEAGTSTP